LKPFENVRINGKQKLVAVVVAVAGRTIELAMAIAIAGATRIYGVIANYHSCEAISRAFSSSRESRSNSNRLIKPSLPKTPGKAAGSGQVMEIRN